MRTTSRPALASIAVGAVLMTAACGAGDGQPATAAGSTDDAGVTTLRIGASPVPHAEILEFVDAELADEAGLDLEIVTFDDYVLPNTALAEGELDANYFQHVPYLDAQVESQGFDFAHFDGVHIEPYGLYSSTVTSVEDIPEGGTLAITNDPGNQARALDLLVEAGLITLAETEGDATLLDVEGNPKNLELIETAPEQLVRSLEDVDAAVINGNFALEAGLNPAQDAILLEAGEGNPYANIVAVRSDQATDPALEALDDLLHSDEVRAFIAERWPAGEVVPAF